MDMLRRRRIEYGVIATVVLVLVILLWPSFDASGDEEDPSPDEPTDQIETPTPEPEPTPEPTPTPEPEYGIHCTPADGAQVLSAFVTRFNAGDLDALADLLPAIPSQQTHTELVVGMENDRLLRFHQHEFTPDNRRSAVLDYLEERMDAGESWRVREYSVEGLYHDPWWENPEIDRIHVSLERSAGDMHPHLLEGEVVVNCSDGLILLWDFTTDDPDLALPIMVDDFIDALGPYGPSQRRSLRMIVSVDERPDGGVLDTWDVRRQEATAYGGGFVERIEVFDAESSPVASYVNDGQQWSLDQRGWEMYSRLPGGPPLPFEIRLPRREPSVTGDAILQYDGEIPDQGSHRIVWDLAEHRDILASLADFTDLDVVAGELEVRFTDGAVVESRYQLFDDDGDRIYAFSIRWIAMERHTNYPLEMFAVSPLPAGRTQQYRVPPGLGYELRLASESAQLDDYSELYTLTLENITVPLFILVSPSRGGMAPDGMGSDWPSDYELNHIDHQVGRINWADPDGADYPTMAVWDTGYYRFELRISSSLPSYAEWDEDELAWLVGELSATSIDRP